MIKFKLFTLSLLLAAGLFHTVSYAESNLPEQQRPALKVGFGLERPPYIYPNHEDGLEIDIIKAVINEMGYDIESVFVSNTRGQKLFQNQAIDLISIAPIGIKTSFYVSDPYITFNNVIISKKSNPKKLLSFDDLSGGRLTAFQNAKHLSKPIRGILNKLALYIETPKQSVQVLLLYKNRVDYIFSEKRVFEHYLQKAKQDGFIHPDWLDYQAHNLLEPTLYGAKFIKEDHRNEFNDALKRIRTSGLYDHIVSHYITH